MIHVLFVCLGNICRSPLAEGIFKELIREEGLSDKISCDSCGTSNYHIGELAHELSREVAQKNGFELTHRARQLKSADFNRFDYLLAMDASNLQNMRRVAGAERAPEKLFLMRKFDNQQSGQTVTDPYGGDESDFDECYEVLRESCTNFLAFLKKQHPTLA